MPRRIAMAPQVKSDHPEVFGKARRDVIEAMGVAADPVQHDQRGLVGLSPLEEMQPQAADGDHTIGGRGLRGYRERRRQQYQQRCATLHDNLTA
jgi:hypothetical protein